MNNKKRSSGRSSGLTALLLVLALGLAQLPLWISPPPAEAWQIMPFSTGLQNGSFEDTPGFNTTGIPQSMITNGNANAGRNWAQWDQTLIPGWSTTASDYRIEIWHGPFTPNVPGGIAFSASDGTQFAEINGTQVATLYQDIATTSGSLYRWSIDHRGRRGIDTANLRLGAPSDPTGGAIQYAPNSPVSTTMASGNADWTTYAAFYTATSTTTRFALEAVGESGGDPRMGNMVDNATWTLIANPTEQTIWEGDALHDSLTTFDSLIDWVDNSWGLMAEPTDPLFDPTALLPGIHEVPVTIIDSGGNTVGHITSIVNVLAANEPPIANDDAFHTAINTPVSGNVLTNDIGVLLQIVTPSVVSANGVTVTIDAAGNFTYTPPTGWTGSDTFDYTVRQDDGQQATATVTITVDPLPQAQDDSLSTNANTAVSGSVLTNDSGMGIANNPVIIRSLPTNGNVGFNYLNGSFVYTPHPNFSGWDSFTYEITDRNGQTSIATVSILVKPVAVNDSNSTKVDTPVSGSVLANDLGSSLSILSFTQPSNGTVVMNTDGTYTYTPKPGFVGTDTFSYAIVDGTGTTATATVTITVLSPIPPTGDAEAWNLLALLVLLLGSGGLLLWRRKRPGHNSV